MTIKSEGQCNFCKKVFSSSVITKHLESCSEKVKQDSITQNKRKVFHLRASCGPFWVNFQVDSSSPLKEVDSFLRNLWLECCGHLSAFRINNQTYSVGPDKEFDDKSMVEKLEKVIYPGLSFSHEYDFGTTTELSLKCISQKEGSSTKKVVILAKNSPLPFECAECQKTAVSVCSQCIFEDKYFFCENCSKEHECGEEMLLPVVNSPRMGMCGYTGND